jgi:hypothetical protein
MTDEEIAAKLAEIESLDARIDSLRGMRDVLLQEWADAVCPYEVDEVVDVQGYSHRGKLCRIDKVYATSSYHKKHLWAVKATVLKKDFSPSVHRVGWNADSLK